MKLGMVPENLVERLALLSGMLPPGIFECWFGIMLARTVMAATKLDVFESLAAGPLNVAEVANRCGTHPRATEKLLNALVGVGCLKFRGKRYGLRRSARSWLLKDGKNSFRDQNLLHYLEWRWWEHCEEFVRTGEPLRVHQTMSDEEWGIYQRGMRSGIEMPAHWVARHLPLSRSGRCWTSADRTGTSRWPSAGSTRASRLRSWIVPRRSSTLPRSSPKREWETVSSIARAMP